MEGMLLGTRLLVEQKEAEVQSKGGILIPTQAATKPREGTVVMVGEAVDETKSLVGRRILFDHFAGVEITLDERPYLVMDIEDIILIFEKE